MNFLERNAENLKSGNLTLTFIMLAAALGMSGWLYIDLTEHNFVVNNSANISVLPGADGTPYEGDNYTAVATLMSIIIIAAITVGILTSKINNEYMKSDTAEVIVVFILLLAGLTLFILDLVPDENDGLNTDETSLRETTYAVSGIILVAIALGMVTNVSGIAKMYNVFGTGVALVMMVILVGLYAWLYHLLAVENSGGNTYNGKTRPTVWGGADSGNFGRELTQGETNVLITALSFVSILVFLAFFHIWMERKTFGKMFGTKASSPKRVSPKRKSSPKRTSPRRKTKA